MAQHEDCGIIRNLGAALGRAAHESFGQSYALEMKAVTDFLALANDDELDTLFFWLEEGVRNYAASTEQSLKLLREAAEAVGYDHQGRYKSTFFVR